MISSLAVVKRLWPLRRPLRPAPRPPSRGLWEITIQTFFPQQSAGALFPTPAVDAHTQLQLTASEDGRRGPSSRLSPINLETEKQPGCAFPASRPAAWEESSMEEVLGPGAREEAEKEGPS